MLSEIEQTRLQVSKNTGANKKSQLGQFLTPSRIAEFMASLFPVPNTKRCDLLDAGAGIGSLSCAFLERCSGSDLGFDEVRLTAYECDESLHSNLEGSLSKYMTRVPLSYDIAAGDFIENAVNLIQFGHVSYTHAILNPPYKKINSDSRYRFLLRQTGIETVNLYSAFVALSVSLMSRGGQVVAIIPRSFCNGPYYRPFREYLLERTAIRHIHLFESRKMAFKDDDVLQENIIIRLECGAQQGRVTISTSSDDSFADLSTHEYPFEKIIFPDDKQRFIHIPTSPDESYIEQSSKICHSLKDIGINVSTGPVVDFRLREYLRDMPEAGTVPLLYPAHFCDNRIEWPKVGIKKPNAILLNADTEKWFYPNGYYCVVRRFSSKEESRRIVASVVNPTNFGDVPMLGFENHLNLFHEDKRGLSRYLAHGLTMYLNTTAVDEQFRRFSGHTQVNATDLKLMKYPSRDALTLLGEWAMSQTHLSQTTLDDKFNALLNEK